MIKMKVLSSEKLIDYQYTSDSGSKFDVTLYQHQIYQGMVRDLIH